MDETVSASASRLPRGASQPKLSPSALIQQHAMDWLHVFLLGLLFVGLYQIRPIQQQVTADDLKGVSRPLYPNTVPSLAVPGLAAGVPLVCFLCLFLVQRDTSDLHHSILGLLFSVLLAAAITDSLKPAVGRPRPDFFWRCFPDGKPVFAPDGNVACNGPPSLVDEGRRSFPSGHSSWSFSGLAFLALFICGKIHTFSTKTFDIWRVIYPLIPLGVATAVGLSRVADYWHFPTDVMAGAFIGILTASLSYFRLYPPLTRDDCHLPRLPHTGQARKPSDTTGEETAHMLLGEAAV